MTATEAHRIFQTLIDKKYTAYVDDVEFTDLWNEAQKAILNDFFYNRHKKAPNPYRTSNENSVPKYGYEITHVEGIDLQPITEQVNVSSTAGAVNVSDLEGGFSNSTALYHLANMLVKQSGSDTYYMAKAVRSNDINRFQQNDYKKSSATKPLFVTLKGKFQVYPENDCDVRATCIRFPKDINYDDANNANNIDPEMGDRFNTAVLYRAVNIVGMPLRDEAMYNWGKQQEMESS